MTESINTGIVHLGGDKFSLNGTTMALAELIMILELDRAENLEKQLAVELQSMAELNALLKEANQMLALARQQKGEVEDGGHNHMAPELKEFFQAHDIKQGVISSDDTNYTHNKEEWETSIENLKGFIDSLNSRSQLDMINISSLLKKRDESLTLPSNTNSNIHQTNQGIIGKI